MTSPGNESTFGAYASFYDDVYAQKDYASETAWIVQRVASMGVSEGRWLDVGCGTGRHLAELPTSFQRFGMDSSEEMLSHARERLQDDAELLCARAPEIPFDGPFDVISAIFAVVSYMSGEGELDAFLRNASARLRPGGVLFFDVWHGPPVLVERPERRWGWCDSKEGRLLRLSWPEHDLSQHTVNVHYELLHFVDDRLVSDVTERHRLRYYFSREVSAGCVRHGLARPELTPFMEDDRPIGVGDWSMAVLTTRIRKQG